MSDDTDLLHAIFRASPVGLVVLDGTGKIRLWNPMAQVLFGWSAAETIGRTLPCVPPANQDEVRSWIEAAWSGKTREPVATNWRTKVGADLLIEVSVVPLRGLDQQLVGVLVVAEDYTERKRMEQRLIHAQKMDAIGKLASRIAHDFNNLLTVINGRSHRMLGQLRPEDQLWREADIIHQTGERAAKLTRQLLAFSQGQVFRPQSLDLNTILSDLESMLRSLIGEGVELVFRLDPALHPIRSDPAQIEQLLINLTVNAAEAMPNGGVLTIQTANLSLDEEQARQHPGASAGWHATLTVCDTGVGMDAATQARLFEPFFTTKDHGAGLGLFTVYGIVRHSGGFITVNCEPGRGTTFRICLPACPGAAESAPVTDHGRGETVLVVEDEDDVRALVVQVLDAHGYTVMAARSWVETFGLVKGHRGRIHLLLTDVILPQMSGREIAASLAPLCPGLKVLYMSGYADSSIVQYGVLEAGVHFMQKPFSPEQLVRTVREVLDSA